MSNHETELRLQAFLDGEQSAGDATGIRELLTRDPEARSLIEELKATRTLLIGNELDRQVPESREFYWSKIRRQIELQEQRVGAAAETEAVPAWWIRFLAPAGVLTALAVFVAVSLRSPEGASPIWAMDDGHEIETPLEETSSFSFRSEAAAMTVVWVDSHRE
jgi:anti-sigma factor RsiW